MGQFWPLAAVALLSALPLRTAFSDDITASLPPEVLQQANDAVDRGLQFISPRQNGDGSFSNLVGPSERTTSLVVLAFLSRGEQPGHGRYGKQLRRAIDWLLSTQREDGSFSTQPPDQLPGAHAIVALALCEAYSSVPADDTERTSRAIRRALAYSRGIQQSPKMFPSYKGGWCYKQDDEGNQFTHWSTLGGTMWELYFLRSAHNAGFQVPQSWIDEGLGFIEKCYQPGPRMAGNWEGRRLPVGPNQGVFFWFPQRPPGYPIWADTDTTAAAMLSFQLHGRREDPILLSAADWLVAQPVADQGDVGSFYYACYITRQAIAQLGGEHWRTFYPRVVARLVRYQDSAGSFREERWQPFRNKSLNGPVHNSAFAILCLTLPDQLLPIHQR